MLLSSVFLSLSLKIISQLRSSGCCNCCRNPVLKCQEISLSVLCKFFLKLHSLSCIKEQIWISLTFQNREGALWKIVKSQVSFLSVKVLSWKHTSVVTTYYSDKSFKITEIPLIGNCRKLCDLWLMESLMPDSTDLKFALPSCAES